MSNFTITEENTREAIIEAFDLAEAHYNEVETRSLDMPFNMDVNLVYEYMRNGILFLYVVRNLEGEMVGYFCNQLLPDPFTSQLVGKEFGIYLKPEYRNKNIFQSLLATAEEGIQDRGGRLQYLSFKHGYDTGLAERFGYSITETVYQRVLEE